MNRKITILAVGIPALMLILSITAFIINTRIAEGKPFIEEISPHIAAPGQKIHIKGKNFGDRKESSRVYMSSLDLLSRYIVKWSDRDIEIVIPEKARSGLVSVETGRGISEPSVFVLQGSVPLIGAGAYIPGLPFIETIDPARGGAGVLVTIKGDNFGDRRDNGAVLFSTLLSGEKDSLDGSTALVNFQEAADDEIVYWSDREIRLYLPDFVDTGDVFVRTESGYSNAVYFEQSLSRSGISLSGKKTYMIRQSVDLSFSDQDGSGLVNLWMQSPVETIYQRNVVNLGDRNFDSTRPCASSNLYRLESSDAQRNLTVVHNSIVDVYSRSYAVDPSEIKGDYDKLSPLYMKYTAPTGAIPSQAARISSVSRSVTRRKTGGFAKARAIYDYVIARLAYSDAVEEWSPDLVVDTQIADARAYSLLFASLARSAGIPARPVTGLLVESEKDVRPHWWVEFYIQGFGWFPADPALADGMPFSQAVENPVEYYWGNIDNQHIAFSRGEKVIPRLFPDGIVISETDHAFVTHNVETGSAINNLHLNWSDVRITAIY